MTSEGVNEVLSDFVRQMDAEERAMFLHALCLMKAAKSRAWFTRRLHEFDDWYRQRRGLPCRKVCPVLAEASP